MVLFLIQCDLALLLPVVTGFPSSTRFSFFLSFIFNYLVSNCNASYYYFVKAFFPSHLALASFCISVVNNKATKKEGSLGDSG